MPCNSLTPTAKTHRTATAGTRSEQSERSPTKGCNDKSLSPWTMTSSPSTETATPICCTISRILASPCVLAVASPGSRTVCPDNAAPTIGNAADEKSGSTTRCVATYRFGSMSIERADTSTFAPKSRITCAVISTYDRDTRTPSMDIDKPCGRAGPININAEIN